MEARARVRKPCEYTTHPCDTVIVFAGGQLGKNTVRTHPQTRQTMFRVSETNGEQHAAAKKLQTVEPRDAHRPLSAQCVNGKRVRRAVLIECTRKGGTPAVREVVQFAARFF